MPAESIIYRTQSSQAELPMSTDDYRKLMIALLDAIKAVTAKLDADAGVTDTNYTATVATFVTK